MILNLRCEISEIYLFYINNLNRIVFINHAESVKSQLKIKAKIIYVSEMQLQTEGRR